MNEPDDTLEQTRAALAPTLNATAAILPLIAQAKAPRFSPELAERWQETARTLAKAWLNRPTGGDAPVRKAVFALCALALELKDADSLALSEALASATDCLEDPEKRSDPRLLAALAAAAEGLSEASDIELPSFASRAQYVTRRLQEAQQAREGIRTATLNRLFVSEASECLNQIDEALEVLPPDIVALIHAIDTIIVHAEPLEMRDIIDRCRLLLARLRPRNGYPVDLDDPETRADVLARIALVEDAILAIPVPEEEDKSVAPIVFPPPEEKTPD